MLNNLVGHTKPKAESEPDFDKLNNSISEFKDGYITPLKFNCLGKYIPQMGSQDSFDILLNNIKSKDFMNMNYRDSTIDLLSKNINFSEIVYNFFYEESDSCLITLLIYTRGKNIYHQLVNELVHSRLDFDKIISLLAGEIIVNTEDLFGDNTPPILNLFCKFNY